MLRPGVRRGLLLAVALVAAGGGALVLLPSARLRLGGPGAQPSWRPAAVVIPDGGCAAAAATLDEGADAGARTRFAVIGDYGNAGPNEQAVADLVKSWRPAFILTTGDNNYPKGEASTIDLNIGLFYHDYIAPYRGQYGCGATHNRFFPSLGNHDWYAAGAQPYLDYFTLPGNERYYDVLWGDVHVFAIDSDPQEPDGVDADSVQARWLRQGLASSPARWQIVYMHRPPYSSGPHGSSPEMRWPFKQWGADLVLAGHDHIYERVEIDGLTFVVNGLGGAAFYALGLPVEGSAVRFQGGAGALFVEADATTLRAHFQTVEGRQIDELTLGAP